MRRGQSSSWTAEGTIEFRSSIYRPSNTITRKIIIWTTFEQGCQTTRNLMRTRSVPPLHLIESSADTSLSFRSAPSGSQRSLVSLLQHHHLSSPRQGHQSQLRSPALLRSPQLLRPPSPSHHPLPSRHRNRPRLPQRVQRRLPRLAPLAKPRLCNLTQNGNLKRLARC